MVSTQKGVFLVSPEDEPQRIDHFLMNRRIPLSRAEIQKLIRAGNIRVNGQTVRPSYRIRNNDRVEVVLPDPRPLVHMPEAISIDILYEDAFLVVVNKPPGMVVHPAPGHLQGTLVNALIYHCGEFSDVGEQERPGIVHRLDKGTSGVLVVAKQPATYHDLGGQFKAHSIYRKYWAIVVGKIIKQKGEIRLAIGRDQRNRKKISHRTSRPKKALTRYNVVERFEKMTLVEVIPETGRTHQIRVHFSSIGHPVLGDPLYGKQRKMSTDFDVERPMLHALNLGFIHPQSREYIEFTAPLPADFSSLLEKLRVNHRG